MYVEIAKRPNEEGEILFQNTAAKLGTNAAIIEKVFLGLPHLGLPVPYM